VAATASNAAARARGRLVEPIMKYPSKGLAAHSAERPGNVSRLRVRFLFPDPLGNGNTRMQVPNQPPG